MSEFQYYVMISDRTGKKGILNNNVANSVGGIIRKTKAEVDSVLTPVPSKL
jgi:hypothetical protein